MSSDLNDCSSFQELHQRWKFGQNTSTAETDKWLRSQKNLITKLELSAVLQGHTGCVNTVEWNETGDLLVSGSDDQQIIVWNQDGDEITSFDSGHRGNIFAAKFMRNCNDSKVVSGAADGSVIVNQWRSCESGCSDMLCRWKESRRVKQVVLDQTCDDCFFSCSEYGEIYAYDIRTKDPTLLVHTDQSVKSLATCLVKPTWLAAAFDRDGIKIFDLRKMDDSLLTLATAHSRIMDRGSSMIATYIEFNKAGTELLANYHNDSVYLYNVSLDKSAGPKFAERLEYIRTRQDLQNEDDPHVVLKNPHFEAQLKEADEFVLINNYIKSVETYSRCIAQIEDEWTKDTATKEQKAELAILYQKRAESYFKRGYCGDAMEAIRDFVRSLELFPMNKEATTGVLDSLIEYRQMTKVKQWKTILNDRFATNYDFQEDNPNGKKTRPWSILTMRSTRDYSQRFLGAKNSRTDIKQARFCGGNNEFIVAGSDCGHLFIWERSTGNIIRLLKADDHVLNCVAPHPKIPLLATSGIEKYVRLWSPLFTDDKEKYSVYAPENKQTWLQRDDTNAVDDIVIENTRIERRFTPMDMIRFAVMDERSGQIMNCRPS